MASSLPKPTTEPGRSRPRPIAILVAVLLAAAIEAALAPLVERSSWAAFLPLRQPTVEETVTGFKAERIRTLEPQDVLLVGDSSCLMGLRPRTIAETAGLRSWNAGTVAWVGLGGMADLVERFLATHRAPGLVVLHLGSLTFSDMPRHLQTAFRAQLRGGLGLPVERRALPSYLARYQVQRRLLEGPPEAEDERRPRGVFPSHVALREQLEAERGWMAEPRQDEFRPAPGFALDPRAEGELEGFLAVLDGRGVPVLLVMEPVPRPAWSPELGESYTAIESRLRAQARRHPALRLQLPLARLYPARFCASMTHLLPEGAEQNSREVARCARALLGDAGGDGTCRVDQHGRSVP